MAIGARQGDKKMKMQDKGALTPAQQKMMERARAHHAKGWAPEQAQASYYAQCKRLGKPVQPHTTLSGSADYRVAYKLKGLGLGRIVSVPPHSVSIFVLDSNQN